MIAWNTIHTTMFYHLLLVSKVETLWEDKKLLRNHHLRFVLCSDGQIYGGDFAKFCGLLRTIGPNFDQKTHASTVSNSPVIHNPCFQAIRASDNLKPSEDPMQDTSEHKNQYKDLDRNYYAERVSKIRPASSMRVDNRLVWPQLWR